ncbi:hypothetical protein [Hydrogenophaga sp.]|uniref:hypothetical protein n=1 Tax=Hydrogenophaga sp. TaxID=1904254 RepID=UPI003D0A2947
MSEPLVLLVARSGPRRDALRRCVRECAPDCRIAHADTYLEAMEQATHMPVHLLILDLALDSVLVPAFERFLAHAAPQARLHVFDDTNDMLEPTEPTEVDQADAPAMERLAAMLRSHIRDASS